MLRSTKKAQLWLLLTEEGQTWLRLVVKGKTSPLVTMKGRLRLRADQRVAKELQRAA